MPSCRLWAVAMKVQLSLTRLLEQTANSNLASYHCGKRRVLTWRPVTVLIWSYVDAIYGGISFNIPLDHAYKSHLFHMNNSIVSFKLNAD